MVVCLLTWFISKIRQRRNKKELNPVGKCQGKSVKQTVISRTVTSSYTQITLIQNTCLFQNYIV